MHHSLQGQQLHHGSINAQAYPLRLYLPDLGHGRERRRYRAHEPQWGLFDPGDIYAEWNFVKSEIANGTFGQNYPDNVPDDYDEAKKYLQEQILEEIFPNGMYHMLQIAQIVINIAQLGQIPINQNFQLVLDNYIEDEYI